MYINNDPCFEDKSSSLTLKYRPVHFFDQAVYGLQIYNIKPGMKQNV